MEKLEQLGIRTRIIDVTRQNIKPCREISVCETDGYCPIQDDMASMIYPLLREADIIVMASPIYFYSVTAQLKALIDRSQALWARKYALKLKDPSQAVRRGFFLGVGATSGKKLFDGSLLTAQYFFDGIAARFAGSLTYSSVEKRGQIQELATLETDLTREAKALAAGLTQRHRVVFACRENACRSQMAAAFARIHAGNRLDVASAGSQPADEINPMMQEVMQEKGIDMAHRQPADLETVIAGHRPQEIITMGCGEACPVVPGAKRRDWDLPDPAGGSIEMMRALRDKIENRIQGFIADLD
jgi:multimeric flavodoxin WrbA